MTVHYEFDKASTKRIADAVHRLENEVAVLRREIARRPNPNSAMRDDVIVAKTTTAITGVSTGGTMGSGTCNVYAVSSTGGLTDAGWTVTGYNLSGTSVAANKWLQLKRHFGTGLWLIDFEDCST